MSEAVVSPHKAVYEDVSPKSRLVTFLLAWFLGILGAHLLYTGKRGAVLRIVLTCTLFGMFITIIWGVVDALEALLGNATDGRGKPIKNW